MQNLIACVFTLSLVACGGDDSTSTDMKSASDMSKVSNVDMAGWNVACGVPGDTGNSKGVGKYCNTFQECTNSFAPICSTVGDVTVHFCTDGNCKNQAAGYCGENAGCQCDPNGLGCGCATLACIGPTDGGT